MNIGTRGSGLLICLKHSSRSKPAVHSKIIKIKALRKHTALPLSAVLFVSDGYLRHIIPLHRAFVKHFPFTKSLAILYEELSFTKNLSISLHTAFLLNVSAALFAELRERRIFETAVTDLSQLFSADSAKYRPLHILGAAVTSL